VQDGKSVLTYKVLKWIQFQNKKRGTDRISDTDNMGNILSSLGFFPVATVSKKRKNFRIGDFYISLDEVRNLGNFLEVG